MASITTYVKISQESYTTQYDSMYFLQFNTELLEGNISNLYIDGVESYGSIESITRRYYVNDAEPAIHEIIVEFSDGIVPAEAFANYSGYLPIYELEIGTGIIKVGDYAFESQKMEQVILPEADIEYGYEVFGFNANLKKVVFPKTYDVTIGDWFFQSCTSLEEVDLGIQSTITTFCFCDCSSLKSLTIPSTITEIRNNSFQNCENLKELHAKSTVPPTLRSYLSFTLIATGGTLYYPAGSDYSNWLSTNAYYLGYYGWNGVEVGGTTPPDTGDTLTHSLSVSPSSIVATFDYQTYPFTCTSENIDSIEAVYDVNWIDVNNTLSGGTITVYRNYNSTSRNCTITFNGYYNGAIVATDTLKVYQDVEDTPYVKILPTNNYDFAWDYEGGVEFDIETYGIDYLKVMGDRDIPYFESFGEGEIVIEEERGYIVVKPNASTEENQTALMIVGWKNGEMVTDDVLDVWQEGKPEEEVPKDGSITSTSITIDESAQDVTIKVSQTNMASWDVVELEQGSDYASIGEYDFSTSTIVLEVNQNYTQAIREIVVHISGTDLEGNTKEGWITVEQEATSIEEDPYIALSNNNILIKDVDETKDVEVTYGNIDNINTPTVPEGYEIEEVSRTESGDETKVIYRIKKTAANKGDVTLNFSGDDTTSEDLTIKGWAAPTTPATITYTEYSFDYEGRLVFDYTGGTKGFTMIINGYTKPMDVSFTLTDPDGKLTCTQNELQYDDGYDYATWAWEFTAEANSSSSSYDGTINITYKDGLTDYSHSIPFHIRHANEGQMLRSSNDYEYDKDGELLSLYDYIGISIVNITTLNTPTHPDWITIGEGVKQEGVFYGIDARYNYPISVSANEGASRTGIVVFSGIGKDGETYSVEVTVHQEGDDTVKPIDEGFIELQSLSLVFPSSGGTDTFQVKYYDAQTIYMPELGGDWATITEIGSSEEEGEAWNGTECIVTTKTYQVVAEASDSGREMKVLCKLLSNSNTYFEKDKFVIQQLAPDSSELQGRVVILRYSKTYSYYGSAIGFPPKVGYKGLTVGVPEFSETWVRLGDVSMKTDTEYDYIYEYSLDMDVNNTPFSRNCTITFRGQGADGTLVKATITITQEGQEEIVNEGEYDNYRGYFMDFEGDVHSVSFITNPRSEVYGDIRLAGDSPVVVSYSESKRLWEPVRTSTCTVKVVSSQYLMNLYSGHAHGTQVILKNDTKGITEWVGFMQPNLYNQGFTECMEEIEFEASDTISSLQYFNYEPHFINGKMTVTFHDIITDIMDKCTLINSFYLTEKTYSDSFQSKPMLFSNFYISEENFYSEEGEPWKMYEVLEEICKYMGLVCFQYNDSVYFMDYDKYKAAGTLSGYKYSKSGNDWEREYVLIADSPNSITEESYRNTGADISLDDVFNKVTVKCSYYNFEDVLPDIFDDDKLVNRFGDGAITSISRYGGRENSELMSKTYYRVYDHVDINPIYYLPIKNGNIHETKVTPTATDFEDKYFFRKYVGGNIVDMAHLNHTEANGGVGANKDFDRYLMISQLNRPWCTGFLPYQSPSWENYNFPIMEFKNIPVIFMDNTADTTVERVNKYNGIGFGSSSSRPHNRIPTNPQPAANYLIIKAEAAFVVRLDTEFIDDSMDKTIKKQVSNGVTLDQIREEPALCFYLEIPQKGWWNGSGWVDYKTHFEVPLENLDSKGDFFATYTNAKNTTKTYLFLGTTGYMIPLPKEMTTTQDMYFAIAMPKRIAHCLISDGGDDTGNGGNAYCFIKDLSMSVVNRNTAMYEDEDVIYENVIDEGNVIEGEEIEVKITSDRYNGLSFSNVSTVTAENKNTTDIHFYANGMRLLKPEECIIERYVNQYSTPSIKENVTLDMSFKPYQRITDTYWDKDFVITAQDIDYQMCRQKLTLLEKKKADGKYVYEGYTVPASGRSNYRKRTN